MDTYVQKWGNSLAVRIPIHLAQQLHIHSGSPVTLEIEEGRIIIKPPQYNLNAMLKAITPKNCHHPLLDDQPIGSEEW